MEIYELSGFINSLKKANKHIDQSLLKKIKECNVEGNKSQWNEFSGKSEIKKRKSQSLECYISFVFMQSLKFLPTGLSVKHFGIEKLVN